ANSRALLGDIQLKELPVVGGRVEALLALHHHLRRYQLQHRAHRIRSGLCRFSDFRSALEIANQIVDVEMPNVSHLCNAAKRLLMEVELPARSGFLRHSESGRQQRTDEDFCPL